MNIKNNNYKIICHENLIHDMKLPMTIMYSNLQLLEMHRNLPNDIKNNIISIKNNWYRVMKLINDINDVYKINNGHFYPKFKNYNIVDLVKNISENIIYFATKKDINVIFKSNINKKIIATDKYMLERILLNLLSNSIKFNKRGGEIEVVLEDRGIDIDIKIIDTGEGIERKDINKIFERYITKDSKEGNGIGLSIVYELIKLLNGNIKINESKKDLGTEFIINFPSFIVPEDKDEIKYFDNFYNDNIIQIELSDYY